MNKIIDLEFKHFTDYALVFSNKPSLGRVNRVCCSRENELIIFAVFVEQGVGLFISDFLNLF